MSSMHLAFSSDGVVPLSSLPVGATGIVVDVQADDAARRDRADRLLALGVTARATVTVLQTFPGVVFLCDQTELAVERAVAHAILVKVHNVRDQRVRSDPDEE